jgi:probable F420-dependent oxidoreductase
MKLGVTIPNIELGTDPEPIKMLAQAAEDMGYDYLMVYDHVIGADVAVRPDWKPFNGHPPVYNIDDSFHEPLILYGYIAGVTSRIGLATGVIVAPQRQTVLLAKQVAEIDILSKGRMRLGVGVGWNDLEYTALNEDFTTRGARLTEQINLLRQLWLHRSVTFQGRWHKIDAMGLKPRPIQQPIPIWIGGDADLVLKRVAQVGDGWYVPSYLDEPRIRERLNKLFEFAQEAHRDPKTIGVEGIIRMHGRTADRCAESLEMWSRLGASHVTFNTESDAYRGRLPTSQMERQGDQPDLAGISADESAVMRARIAALELFKKAALAYVS